MLLLLQVLSVLGVLRARLLKWWRGRVRAAAR
jgi:hypothetical protein